MFTIKQVLTSGEECYWEATNVRMGRAPNGPQRYDDRTMYFDMPQPNGETIVGSVDRGTVYIMNCHGKTVDRYTLGNPNVPPEGTDEDVREGDDPPDHEFPVQAEDEGSADAAVSVHEVSNEMEGHRFARLDQFSDMITVVEKVLARVEKLEAGFGPGRLVSAEEVFREIDPDPLKGVPFDQLLSKLPRNDVELHSVRDSRPDLIQPFPLGVPGTFLVGDPGDEMPLYREATALDVHGGIRVGSTYLSAAEVQTVRELSVPHHSV